MQSENKFNLILNDFNCSAVLKTVIDIALSIWTKEEIASFAFVGAYKVTKETKETPNTQRFKIYKRIAEYFFGDQTFMHVYEERINCYMLVNKMQPNPNEVHEGILNMFATQFPEVGSL